MKKICLIVFVILLLAICPNEGSCQTTLKTGALIPFTGRWGDSGRECTRGLLDATRWLNQHGGVFGRKLEILPIGDTFQPLETIAAYRKLKESDHILLLYLYSTETALAMNSHVHFDRIPTLVSSLPSQFANPVKYPYLFTLTPTPLDCAKIAMKFISENSEIKGRKPKTVFIGSPDYSDQHFLDEVKAFAKELGLDMGPDIFVTDFSSFRDSASTDASSSNLSSFLSVINQYSPDFAYLSLTSREALTVLQVAQKLNLKTRWICNMKAFNENLASLNGVFGVQPVAPYGEEVPGMAAIKEAHQRWHPYDSHTLSYVEGWATVLVMAEALGESLPEERLSRERVKDSLESLRHFVMGGLFPPITITPADHRPSEESRIFMIKDGKLFRHTGFITIGSEKK